MQGGFPPSDEAELVTAPGFPLPTRRPNPTRRLLRILVFSFRVLPGTSLHGSCLWRPGSVPVPERGRVGQRGCLHVQKGRVGAGMGRRCPDFRPGARPYSCGCRGSGLGRQPTELW